MHINGLYYENTESNPSPELITTILDMHDGMQEEIPRFCFHNSLPIAGNCRMCAIELDGVPKPVASCAYPGLPNVKSYNQSAVTIAARENILEFLLINHPLDCPICDQGGECDLQDQTYNYGSDASRFFFLKKSSVEDKNFKGTIKTIMTRCIQCTRCVRYEESYVEDRKLGVTGRGNSSEITNYTLASALDSSCEGNAVDLCPVGALTSKQYAFTARPWEIRNYNSIDIFDGIGSNIQVGSAKNVVSRILPRANKNINMEWTTNRARLLPLLQKKKKISFAAIKSLINSLFYINWRNLLSFLTLSIMSWKQLCSIIVSPLCNNKVLKLLELYQINFETSVSFCFGNFSSFRDNFLIRFNNYLSFLERCKCITTINFNFQESFPILYLKLRSERRKNRLKNINLGYKSSKFLTSFSTGFSFKSIDLLWRFRNYAVRKSVKKDKSAILFNLNHLTEDKTHTLLPLFHLLNKNYFFYKKYSVVNFLHYGANFMGITIYNMKPFSYSSLRKTRYLLSFLPFSNNSSILNSAVKKMANTLKSSFHFFISKIFLVCDLLIPVKNFFEQTNSYLNVEGKRQKLEKCIEGSSESKEINNIVKESYHCLKKAFFKGKTLRRLLSHIDSIISIYCYNIYYDYLNKIIVIKQVWHNNSGSSLIAIEAVRSFPY